MKKVLIITGANTAREINDLGDEYPVMEHFPEETTPAQFNRYLFEWARNKSSLKEYRIIKGMPGIYPEGACIDYENPFEELIGQKFECEVNEETLEAIIL